jgi:hypothetical protein
VRELTADNELSISERADFDREFEKFGDDGLLLAGEWAGDRKFDGRVIRRQRDQRCDRFEAVRAASGDDPGDIPIDGAAELADRLAGDAPAKVAAPLIKIERQEKRLEPGQIVIAQNLKRSLAGRPLRCQGEAGLNAYHEPFS